MEGYTARGTSPCGNSLQELKEDLERMLKSLDKKVLDYSDNQVWLRSLVSLEQLRELKAIQTYFVTHCK